MTTTKPSNISDDQMQMILIVVLVGSILYMISQRPGGICSLMGHRERFSAVDSPPRLSESRRRASLRRRRERPEDINYTKYHNVFSFGKYPEDFMNSPLGCIGRHDGTGAISISDAQNRCDSSNDCDSFFAYNAQYPESKGRVCFKNRVDLNNEQIPHKDTRFPNSGYFVSKDITGEPVRAPEWPNPGSGWCHPDPRWPHWMHHGGDFLDHLPWWGEDQKPKDIWWERKEGVPDVIKHTDNKVREKCQDWSRAAGDRLAEACEDQASIFDRFGSGLMCAKTCCEKDGLGETHAEKIIRLGLASGSRSTLRGLRPRLRRGGNNNNNIINNNNNFNNRSNA